jgi:hypothetical protein
VHVLVLRSHRFDVAVNAHIEAGAAQYQNVHVIDWWPIASQHPEWHPDGVHLNDTGRAIWAQTIANDAALVMNG